PFAYMMAGLWQKQYREWVRPALPWALFAAVVLGTGILMGGYWAYETLNFGGYWNWDPVENASYVPWLVAVAAIHAMIIAKKNTSALKMSLILSIGTFILILYATFIIRSGILSTVSVHSFTDLGLSGQLLLFLFFFLFLAIGISIWRWKTLPADTQEIKIYSREFWIFIGTAILLAASFQVLYFTSYPTAKAIIEGFGGVSDLAMPAKMEKIHNNFQLIFALGVAVVSSIGQYMYWQSADRNKLFRSLGTAAIVALVLTLGAVIAINIKADEIKFMLLLWACLFSVIANGSILIHLLRSNYKIAGGSVTHIGLAIMLIGILASGGYSKAISLNNSGLLLIKEEELTPEGERENKENTLLWANQPTQMDDYSLTYKGKRMELRDAPGYYPRNWFLPTKEEYKFTLKNDLIYKGKTYHKAGETVETYPENTYYEIEARDKKGRIFNLYPRIQINEQMGNAASPHVKKEWDRDVYAFVNGAMGVTAERRWSDTETQNIRLKDTLYLNDYVAIFESIQPTQMPGFSLKKGDLAFKATVRVMAKEGDYFLNPVFIISEDRVGNIPEVSDELGIRLALTFIDHKNGAFQFTYNTGQRDFIILKALEKPYINLLWMGVLIMITGFTMATVRRIQDLHKKPALVAAE
ncbi:MAG: cytochrome c biogenesis protein CcsA, partial [Verrucomicrobia bacterium]|nr:cytochrome c biogenesis protein CcsA [Cytophagales bacterium]